MELIKGHLDERARDFEDFVREQQALGFPALSVRETTLGRQFGRFSLDMSDVFHLLNRRWLVRRHECSGECFAISGEDVEGRPLTVVAARTGSTLRLLNAWVT